MNFPHSQFTLIARKIGTWSSRISNEAKNTLMIISCWKLNCQKSLNQTLLLTQMNGISCAQIMEIKLPVSSGVRWLKMLQPNACVFTHFHTHWWNSHFSNISFIWMFIFSFPYSRYNNLLLLFFHLLWPVPFAASPAALLSFALYTYYSSFVFLHYSVTQSSLCIAVLAVSSVFIPVCLFIYSFLFIWLRARRIEISFLFIIIYIKCGCVNSQHTHWRISFKRNFHFSAERVLVFQLFFFLLLEFYQLLSYSAESPMITVGHTKSLCKKYATNDEAFRLSNNIPVFYA